jgi:glycosyltransferase involved in cell wall biosynthesis
MKIAVVETDSRGGLIHFAYQLSEAFAEVGVETTLVTGRDYELAALPHKCRVEPMLNLWPAFETPPATRFAAWVRRIVWPLRRAFRAWVLAREWWRLTRFLRRLRPDVVVFSMIRFRFLSVFLQQLQGEGIVLAQVCHEFANRETKPNFASRLADSLFASPYRAFSSIFLLSQSAREAFCKTYPEEASKTLVVPHGPELLFPERPEDVADLKARYRISDDDQLVLMFGGLRPSKGVPDLIEAFAQVKDRPHARLIIAGYPSREFDADAEIERISRLGIGERAQIDMRYLGMSELGSLIRLASVVVFPYHSATSSGALALAMSLGRPVIATAIGGLVDAVEDRVTGRLVRPNSPDAMAQALEDTLGDPVAAEGMAMRGQEVLLSERSWPFIANAMLINFRSLQVAPR